MSPLISDKFILSVFASHFTENVSLLWAAGCSQTLGCRKVSNVPGGGTPQSGGALPLARGTAEALSCIFGPFIWHCCQCLVCGHQVSPFTVKQQNSRITLTKAYVKEGNFCFSFSLLYASSRLRVLSHCFSSDMAHFLSLFLKGTGPITGWLFSGGTVLFLKAMVGFR